MNIAIIGGGAAGMFAAIQVKENFPDAQVVVFEKSNSLLSKLKISGGGRCNVTNGAKTVSELIKAYPRGGKKLKKLFHRFNNHHMMQWLNDRGVDWVLQEDGCVFPKSQDSQTIIDCFINECKRLGVSIEKSVTVMALKQVENQIELGFQTRKPSSQIFDKVIVCTGGSPKKEGLIWLEKSGHQIENPVPSLFTFNMPHENITKLMGIVVENAMVNIQGTKLKSEGPLLITHWGMSGPAVLILSSFGARMLSEKDYHFMVQVNWVHEANNETVRQKLEELIQKHPRKQLGNYRPYLLPERLWLHILEKCVLAKDKTWSEIGKKAINKLINTLTNDVYKVTGKTKFRDEFVTCGGLSLESIDMNSMQSKVVKNLYFAGEVCDIDAITGGYNFQAAWTTAFIAAQLK